MNWLVAGLIGGIGAFFADYVMWSKVVNKGLEAFGTMPPTPEEGKKMMAANLPKAAVASLVFGVLLALFYGRFKGGLSVQGGGILAGMEFATILWLSPTAPLPLSPGVWSAKGRPLPKPRLR